MKLVIATPLYPPESGGPATYSKLLEEELPKHGWEVTLIKFGDVRHLPKLIRHIAYGWKVFRAARRADAVFALDPVSTGLPAHVAAELAGKPFYVKIVGDYAWEQGTQRFGVKELLDDFVTRTDYPLAVRFLKRVEKHVAQSARRIIVPSEYWKRILSAWGIDAGRVRVIYNAPHVPGKSSLVRPTGVPSSYIVSVARLVPWKGMDGLIRAVAHLRKKGSQTNLVIVGGGPERGRLEALARDLGVADAVIFTGALPQGSAAAYLAYADMLVLNTGYEGFSHLIIEAFALGTPVVTTPVGGNTEQVIDGETGLLFPFQDVDAMVTAIERVTTDDALRERVVAGAQEKLKTFSKEQLIAGIIETIHA